jgi:hypothetical protein
MTGLDDPARLVRQAADLDRRGKMIEAITAYQTVLAHYPGLPDCWYSLAMLQRKARQFNAALASYQRALDQGVRRPEEVHLNRGVIYADHLGQQEAAERELKCALALNPAYFPALMNLANLHEDLGRRPEAIALYERILALDARCFEALARYANLTRFTDIGDPVIERLRGALGDPDASSAERASIGFALGRAFDACGHYEAAFDTYARANRDSRDSAPAGTGRYDRALEERFIEQLIAAFRPPVVSDAHFSSGMTPRPIFICGMFRSGSTLVEQLLAGHPRVAGGGEIDFLPFVAQQLLTPFPESLAATSPARLKEIAASYVRSMREMHAEAQFVTDKRPDNFIYLGLIKRLFPDARIVHTTREPLDTCLSIFFLHLDHRMSYALDLLDIAHHYRQYRRLMAHWKSLYGADILDLSYDDLVREPKPAMVKLLDFLGLEWNDNCLSVPPTGRTIKTASVWQAREPIYQGSSGRSQHYLRQLEALRVEIGGEPR